MDKEELLAINSEFAAIVAEARNAVTPDTPANTVGGAALLFDPVSLYGRAAVRLSGNTDTDNATVADFERLIKVTALKIRAGDRTYIIESLTGQAAWLQALSMKLSDYAAHAENERQKVALCQLLLRMQTTVSKTLATLAAVGSLG